MMTSTEAELLCVVSGACGYSFRADLSPDGSDSSRIANGCCRRTAARRVRHQQRGELAGGRRALTLLDGWSRPGSILAHDAGHRLLDHGYAASQRRRARLRGCLDAAAFLLQGRERRVSTATSAKSCSASAMRG